MRRIRKIVVVCLCLIVCATLSVALCLTYVSTGAVTDVPQSISVQTVDGKLCLVTKYSPEWTYCFQVEQEFDGEFMLVQTLASSVNTIALSSFQVSFVAGQNYRFSACYANENVLGDWSKSLVWTAAWQLSTPENVTQNGSIISWDAVSNADGYVVSCVNSQADVQEFSVSETEFDLENLTSGTYVIYICATSTNEHLYTSNRSESCSVSL